VPEAARAADPKPEASAAADPTPEPDDKALPARWRALQAAFLEASAPVTEALDRADRARAARPGPQAQAAEAEAAYLAAKLARERAEADGPAPADPNPAGGAAVAKAEEAARLAQARLDDYRRTRQRLIDLFMSKGIERAKAEAAAGAYYENQIKAQETRAGRAQLALKQLKGRQESDARYGGAKQAKEREAAVAALRAEELARQADWEKAKRASPQPAADGPGLTPEEKGVLDRLVEVLRAAGSRPPSGADSAEFRAFLDAFEAALADARSDTERVAGAGVAARYNALVNRLLRAQDGLGRE
jgi:hypothetical protein